MKANETNLVKDNDLLSFGFIIMKISRAVNYRYHQELSAHGLTTPQALVIMTISRAKEINQSSVSKATMLDKANVSAIIRKLHGDGLIIINQSSRDGRVSYLSLTKNGESAAKLIETIDKNVSAEIEKNFPTQEMKKIRSLFSEILSYHI